MMTTLAESIAIMAERIVELEEALAAAETLIRDLRDQYAAVSHELFDTLVVCERLRQEIDLVTDREREGRAWHA